MNIDESNFDVNDSKWFANLNKKISLNIFDESHMLKTLTIKIFIVIHWLNLNFHFFVFATFISNDIENLAEYVKFIVFKNKIKSLWIKKSFKKMNIKRKTDSFFLIMIILTRNWKLLNTKLNNIFFITTFRFKLKIKNWRCYESNLCFAKQTQIKYLSTSNQQSMINYRICLSWRSNVFIMTKKQNMKQKNENFDIIFFELRSIDWL